MTASGQAPVEIRHSFFVAGPTFTGIIDEAGNEVWDSGRGGARDGWVLSSGNVLIAWGDVVREFTPEKTVVFEYQLDPVNQEIGAVERLSGGNTLITAYHAKVGVKLLEVTPDKEIVWTYEGPHRAHHFQILTTSGKPIEGRPLR